MAGCVATEHGFAVTDRDDDWTLRPVAEAFDDPTIRMNEGGCDLAGGFLCGSMAYAKTTGDATLYRLDPDGTVEVVLEGSTISNGFSLDPSGTLAYYIDTPTHRVDVFDVGADGRTLTGRRPFVTIEDDAGGPDGLAVDADGRRVGRAVRRIGGPWLSRGRRPWPRSSTCRPARSPRARSPARTSATLFITTSQEDLEPRDGPLAGTLFAVRPGVVGLLPLPFRG